MDVFSPVGVTGLLPSGSHVFTAQHGDDRSLLVEFFEKPVAQTFRSEKEGRPIFESVPHIRIVLAGGKSEVVRPVKMADDERGPSDVSRFPQRWAAFKSNQEQVQTGTIVDVMPWLNPSLVFELKAQKIFTVEQLANLPDSALNMVGGRALRDKAQQYLLAASGDHSVISSLEAENRNLKTDMEGLKAQVAELAAALSKRGPGRPRKEESTNAD